MIVYLECYLSCIGASAQYGKTQDSKKVTYGSTTKGS